MPAHGYVEENVLAAMLAAKRLAGVAPEVSLGECVTYMPPPSANKMSAEVQNRDISGTTKRFMSSKKFFKKKSVCENVKIKVSQFTTLSIDDQVYLLKVRKT